MKNITYHKATIEDTSTLVEQRIQFAIELSGEQSEGAIQALHQQITAYFSKATADNSCISFIATCNETVAALAQYM